MHVLRLLTTHMLALILLYECGADKGAVSPVTYRYDNAPNRPLHNVSYLLFLSTEKHRSNESRKNRPQRRLYMHGFLRNLASRGGSVFFYEAVGGDGS